MPEDVLHCGFLFNACQTFACTVFEIPGRMVLCDYDILADTHYFVWNCLAEKRGSLYVSGLERTVTMHVYEDEEDIVWSDTAWSECFRLTDFVIMPMVFRSGACVKLADNKLGLIVPHNMQDEANRDKWLHFHADTGKYHLLLGAGEAETTTTMDALDVLKGLIVPGTCVYIDLNEAQAQGSSSGNDVRAHLRTMVGMNERHLRWLVVRVNVPSVMVPNVRKVYVTYMLRPNTVHANGSTFSTETIAVDPDMLVCALPDESVDFIAALVSS